MAYCTASDVRLVIHTTLTDDQITTIIEMSDAEINRKIGVEDPSNKLVKKLSMLLTAWIIKTRYPNSQAIGEYREDASDILEVWKEEIERIFRLYKTPLVRSSDYRYIDESKRYPEG